VREERAEGKALGDKAAREAGAGLDGDGESEVSGFAS